MNTATIRIEQTSISVNDEGHGAEAAHYRTTLPASINAKTVVSIIDTAFAPCFPEGQARGFTIDTAQQNYCFSFVFSHYTEVSDIPTTLEKQVDFSRFVA